MILQGHATTPDELEVVSSSAATLDVVTTYVTTDQPASATTMGPAVTHSLISSATTTVLLTGPAASKAHGVKTLNIRNRDASLSCQVTIQIDRNSVGTDVVQLHSFNLAPGEAMEWSNELGWYQLSASPAAATSGATNYLTGADQSLGASDTYLNNSALSVAALGTPKIGRSFHWRFIVSKTAAGTATPILTVRTGTAGTTADTARVTFTWGAGTAAADRGEIEMDVLCIAAGASAVLRGKANWTTNLTTTGLSNAVKALQPADSGTFDISAAGLLIGLSYNAGASGAHTLEYMRAWTEQI